MHVAKIWATIPNRKACIRAAKCMRAIILAFYPPAPLVLIKFIWVFSCFMLYMLRSSLPILQSSLYWDICMFHLCFTIKNLKLFMLLQSSYLACPFSLEGEKRLKLQQGSTSFLFWFFKNFLLLPTYLIKTCQK